MSCSGLRFLVVEDHPVQRRVMVLLLQSLGAANVHEAQDGRAALAVIRDPARPVDIIFSDLSMPGMDGIELIRNMAAAASPMALAIVSASGPQVLASVKKMAVAYGVHMLGTVAKPLNGLKIARVVGAWRQHVADSRASEFSSDEFRAALSSGAVEAFFEPWADLSGTMVRGFQVHPYWRHPVRGVMAPRDFIDAAMRAGLGDELVPHLLRRALTECRRWDAAGYRLQLALSLAGTTLERPGLARDLRQEALGAGIEPARITLGISGALRKDRGGSLASVLRELRHAGFGVAAEDFGSGSAWAGELAHLPFTRLLIAPNIVNGLQHDDSADAGVVVALDLARRLDLPCIAQGVRTLDEWNLLQGWGCELGQGAFIGPALESGDVMPWLHESGGRAHALGVLGKPLELRSPVSVTGTSAKPAPGRRTNTP